MLIPESNKSSEASILKGVVRDFHFDVTGIYQPIMDKLSSGLPITEAYDVYSPNPLEQCETTKGSDCFGLSVLYRHLCSSIGNGEQLQYLPFDTKGLSSEAKVITNDVGHMAVFKEDQKNITIFDPGFALTEPITIQKKIGSTQYRSGDGRDYSFTINLDDRSGELNIFSPYQPDKQIGFKLSAFDQNHIPEAQKKYMQVRTTLNRDAFDREGRKIGGIKVKLMEDEVVVWHDAIKTKYPFSAFGNKDLNIGEFEGVSKKLGINEVGLINQVKDYIRYAGQLRQLWPESLRKEYYHKKGILLGEEYHNWAELNRHGFVGGGVVAFIVDGRGNVLLYEVPSTREKPHIGRYAGQLNSLVETAEGHETGYVNLCRGIQEELSMNIDEFSILPKSYREAGYGYYSKMIARCYVLQPKRTLDLQSVHFKSSVEGSKWKWMPIDSALGSELEPNIRPILDLYSLGGLLK